MHHPIHNGTLGIVNYCLQIANEFQARLNRIRNFIPDYDSSSGAANKGMLRDFLQTHCSGKYGLTQGFIYNPTNGDAPSKQCDIVMYDQVTYPPVYKDGPIGVVWPDSVGMVIESRAELTKKSLHESLATIDSAISSAHPLSKGIVFAFASGTVETVLKQISDAQAKNAAKLPNAILLFNRGAMFYRWGWGLRFNAADAIHLDTYQIRTSADRRNPGAAIIAFLLAQMLEVQLRDTAYHASVINLGMSIIQSYTEAYALKNNASPPSNP